MHKEKKAHTKYQETTKKETLVVKVVSTKLNMENKLGSKWIKSRKKTENNNKINLISLQENRTRSNRNET